MLTCFPELQQEKKTRAPAYDDGEENEKSGSIDWRARDGTQGQGLTVANKKKKPETLCSIEPRSAAEISSGEESDRLNMEIRRDGKQPMDEAAGGLNGSVRDRTTRRWITLVAF